MAYVGVEPTNGSTRNLADILDRGRSYRDRLLTFASQNPFRGKRFRRLAAERNIAPEHDVTGSAPSIGPDGQGATNALQQFINKASLRRELVQETLLGSLNKVFGPDTHFDEIVCRQLADARWEIFLGEKKKGLIPLSQSGSGLKTVILVLCMIHLMPVIDGAPLSDYVLAFEELENNLHPALQRRLLEFLCDHALSNDVLIFLTTHSPVTIDILNRKAFAQIIHVTHDGTRSRASVVRAFIERSHVLDDLDVRASDLLQSNGVVWVEGPSDRTYLNRWIELWSNGELIEGQHYQVVFYGGRLLSHLSAHTEGVGEAVSILKVNRNAAIVIDSDKRNANEQINATKRRLVEEISAINGWSWVTPGREIENCIPISVLQQLHPQLSACRGPSTPYSSMFEYLDRSVHGLGKRYANQKPILADQVAALLSRADLEGVDGLPNALEALCGHIRRWNRLPEPTPP